MSKLNDLPASARVTAKDFLAFDQLIDCYMFQRTLKTLSPAQREFWNFMLVAVDIKKKQKVVAVGEVREEQAKRKEAKQAEERRLYGRTYAD